MDNKKVGLLLIVIGLIILGLIVYFLFFLNGSYNLKTLIGGPNGDRYESGLEENNEYKQPEKVIKEITIIRDEDAPVAGEAEIQTTELKKMAMSFAERFGSYSNHSDFSNITDLQIFMTNSMREWSDKYIENNRQAIGDTSVYQGVITKALISEVKDYDLGGGSAKILVQTQKTSSNSGGDSSEVTYQNILITFVKEEGEWKVNEARWQ